MENFVSCIGIIAMAISLGLICYTFVRRFNAEFEGKYELATNVNVRGYSKKTKEISVKNVAMMCTTAVVLLKIIHIIIVNVVSGGNWANPQSWFMATDMPHYLDIAQNGYVTTGEEAMWIVFFPLYPYILGVFGAITGEYFWTGSVLSMAFLVVGMVFLFIWTREEYGEKVAIRTLKYFILFPTQFFSMLPMTESLFIMLIAIFFYCLKREKMWITAFVGFALALTRSAGVLVVFPYALKMFNKYLQKRPFSWENFGKFVASCLPTFIIASGTLVYLLINYLLFGDPFRFQFYQSTHWYQSIGFFGTTLKTLTSYFMMEEGIVKYVLWGFSLLMIAWVMKMLILMGKRKCEYSFFAYSQFMFCISAQWLISITRYSMPILPIYQELGIRMENKTFDIIGTCVFAVLSIAVFILFLTTSAVY